MSDKSRRAARILDALEAAMPEAAIELRFGSPFELVVAVLLSAQTTDKRVNLVTPALFARFGTPEAMAQAPLEEVEELIKTVGLFRTKAKNLVALGQALVARHAGKVPLEREVLSTLPGVGQKTAGVVSMHLGGTRAFPVDTHVHRLSGRLGLSAAKRPDDVEADLKKLVPEARWFQGHQVLIWHGRRVCLARGPKCDGCVVAKWCPQRGV
jgi:endonuclease-3